MKNKEKREEMKINEHYTFKADDVGRTVFLTREAAEEALKAREQE